MDAAQQVRFLVTRALAGYAELPAEKRAHLFDGAATALAAVGRNQCANEARETAALIREAERAQLNLFARVAG